MAKRKAFYASAKQKDLKDFKEAISGLSNLFGEAKNKKGLAEKLGVTPSTLRRWETGKSLPSDDSFQKLKNTYRAYKPIINDHEKRENFLKRQKQEKTKQKEKKKKQGLHFSDLNKWLDTHFHNRYKEAIKYEYFRMLVNEQGLKLAAYYLDNPKEAIFLRKRNEKIIQETFLQMVGVTHDYPYDNASNQMFFRRLPRLATGIRDIKEKSIFDKVRKIFYSGENTDKIENFIGFYFDS